jgi:hypothetical protein
MSNYYKYILVKSINGPTYDSSNLVTWTFNGDVYRCDNKEEALEYLKNSYNGINFVFRTTNPEGDFYGIESKTWYAEGIPSSPTYSSLYTLYVFRLFGDKIKFFNGSSINASSDIISGEIQWKDYS